MRWEPPSRQDDYRVSDRLAGVEQVRKRVPGVNRLLGDFIEKTSGAYRPRPGDAQCPRTDDNQ